MREHIAATGAVLLIAILVVPSTCIAEEPSYAAAGAVITGKAKAKDGDSILIGEGKGTVDARLHGIDAPEWNQECKDKEGRPWLCGKVAKAELAKLVDGKQIQCEVTDIERANAKRPIVRCFDGPMNINEAMVGSGVAWVFDRYAKEFSDYSALKAIETEAKAKGLGLWQGEAEPAWKFRDRRWERYAARAPNGCPIIGNPKSNIHHTPWSRHYPRMFEAAIRRAKDRLWFCSEDEAVAAGFRSPRR